MARLRRFSIRDALLFTAVIAIALIVARITVIDALPNPVWIALAYVGITAFVLTWTLSCLSSWSSVDRVMRFHSERYASY